MTHARAPLTGAAWCATLAAAWWTAASFAAAAGAEPADLPRLLTDDPIRAAAALLAAACHAIVAYLALLTAATALAALSGRETAVRRVRTLVLPTLRPVLDAGAGWALALGAAALPLVPTVAAAVATPGADDTTTTEAPDDTGSPVTMRRLPDEPAPSAADAPVEVLRRLPDREPPRTAPASPTTIAERSGPADPAEPSGNPTAAVPSAADGTPESLPPTTGDPLAPPDHGGASPEVGPPASPTDHAVTPDARVDTSAGSAPDAALPPGNDPTGSETWTIEPGDHLWHVADATLAERGDTDADPERILAYLERLVAANADRLVEPGNADLVLPGQVFVLPAVAAP